MKSKLVIIFLIITAQIFAQIKNLDNPSVLKLQFSSPLERFNDGDGSLKISGELKEWHKITLSLDGPFAHELDLDPNPFRDYKMTVTFSHETGSIEYKVPGYFAADGNAAETSADRGTKWRVHFSPDTTGKWTYKIEFLKGPSIAVYPVNSAVRLIPYDGISGEFNVLESDKKGRDFRAKGRLQYIGKHHLQHAGSKEYFLKAGADAPETFLAYYQFDATYSLNSPIKTWDPHFTDWKEGDPTWQGYKGKGIIGAVNYLAEKGCNVISFLTYNAGGDGDNVWPFVKRNAKLNYDCSKLDQWSIVFDHAQSNGIYLHFKTQETENDDFYLGNNLDGPVPESLDEGETRTERRIYYRELIARFGYLLALNWNLGEENTQTPAQQIDMAEFISQIDPYHHHVVIHTQPNEQDLVYNKLLGDVIKITGVSLQNDWNHTHKRTLQWLNASANSGKPWVVANDEQGSAEEGVPPDPGYKNFDAEKLSYDIDDVRIQTLWGNLMAGGAGVEYYFGYKLPENDLICEDYRSRDLSWDYCRIAIEFFSNENIPFWEMKNHNELIYNPKNEKDKYCFAKLGELYLVYLGYAETSNLDLSKVNGEFDILWFNPREGGAMLAGSIDAVYGGKIVELGNAPKDFVKDWLVVVRAK